MYAIVYIILAVVICFMLLSWFNPAYWNWGILSPANFNIPAFILLALAVIITVFRPIGSIVYRLFETTASALYHALKSIPTGIAYALWIIIPAGLLYLLRVDSLIMGDGHLIVSKLANGEWISGTSIGTSLLLKTLSSVLKSSPRDLLAGLSITSGIVYFIFSYKALKLLIKNPGRRVAMFLILAFSGVSVIFAGYMETYPPLLAWLSIYLYISLKYVNDEFGTLAILITFILGLFWHFLFLAFLPSILFLLNIRYKIMSKKALLFITAVFLIGLYIGGGFIERSHIPLVTPFLPTDLSSYVLFSPLHIIDFLNQIIIVAPVMVLLALGLLILGRKEPGNNQRTFMIFCFISSLLIAFMLDPALGAARDWDLLSIFALPGIMLGFVFLENAFRNKQAGTYILLPILILGLLHTSLFLSNLNDKEKSTDRIVRILFDDPHYQSDYHNGSRIPPFATIITNIYERYSEGAAFMERRTGTAAALYRDYIKLGGQYYSEGNFDKALENFKRVPDERFDNPEYLFHYGRTLFMTNNYDRAVEIFNRALKDTAVADIYYFLGQAYLGLNEPERAYQSFMEGSHLPHDSLQYLESSARLMSEAGRPEYALKIFQHLRDIKPSYKGLDTYLAVNFHGAGTEDSAIHYYRNLLKEDNGSYWGLLGMGRIYSDHQNYDSSLYYFKELEKRYPTDIDALMGLGFAYAFNGDDNEAIATLNNVLGINPSIVPAHDLLARLYLRAGQADNAVYYWNNALRLDSSFARAHLGLAQSHDLLDENIQAYRELKKWLEYDGINTEAEKARELLKKYELAPSN